MERVKSVLHYITLLASVAHINSFGMKPKCKLYLESLSST